MLAAQGQRQLFDFLNEQEENKNMESEMQFWEENW